MKKIMFLLLFPAMMLSSETNGQSGSERKNAELGKSKILWSGSKPGGKHEGAVSLAAGHLLIGSDKKVSGGEFVIDLNTIVNHDLTNESMNNKLVNHLKSEDFFYIKKFPTAKFVITDIQELKNQQPDKDGFKASHLVKGNLTIKNITKPIGFKAAISSKEGKISVRTEKFLLDRTEWGVNYQSKKIFSELKDAFIYDEMELSVILESK